MTDWITTEQVKRAAEEGEFSALRCSLEHHQQGRDAPRGELLDAHEKDIFNLEAVKCACCVMYDCNSMKCAESPCILRENNKAIHHCCNGLWRVASDALIEFIKNPTNANFKAFQEAEAKVCTYIEGVIAKKKAEAKKTKEKIQGCLYCNYEDLNGGDKPCCSCTKYPTYSNFEPKDKKELKPTLRHGDYGIGPIEPFLIIGDGTNAIGYNPFGSLSNMCSEETGGRYKLAQKLGNIFDDLKRNAEDLEEFEMRGQYDTKKRRTLKSLLGANGKIWLNINTGSSYFELDQATEIAHKILQEVATARRKERA